MLKLLSIVSCLFPSAQVVDFESHWLQIQDKIAEDFSGVNAEDRVEDELRERIVALREAMDELSIAESFEGKPLFCERGRCHGAAVVLRKVMKDFLELETKHVTYDVNYYREGGMEHSYVIIVDYFGPNRPLIIDPTIKQFVREKFRHLMPDIFVGSAVELFEFLHQFEVSWSDLKPTDTFLTYMRGTANPVQQGYFEQIDASFSYPYQRP